MAVIDSMKERVSMVAESAEGVRQLAIDKIEEAARLNLASASYLSEVGIRQLRAATSIRDLESMRRFTAETISLSGELTKKMLDDGKAWMSMGADARDRMTDMVSKQESGDLKKKPTAKSASAA